MITLASAALAAGCQKAIGYEDVVFFTGTENSPVTNMYIDGPTSMGLSVTSSSKLSTDMSVSVVVDGAAVDTYNAAHGTSYKMLPEGSYSLSADSFTISAGSSVSQPLTFDIVSMDDFEEGALYCIPFRLTGTSNGMKILETSRTTYVMINQIITTNGINLQQSNYVSFPTIINNADYHDLPVCTMEIRVKMNSFYGATANPGIASVIGVEENFLLRFGDISCDKNQLQLAGREASVTSSLHFNTGQWYHIAVVDDGSTATLYADGEAVGSTDSSGKDPIDLAWDYMDGFHVGFSERGRLMNGVVSEARVWTRALTPTELVNNQCYVDPASEGLLGYWRLDSLNEENKIVDLTGRGNDGEPSNTSLVWEELKCPVVD